MSEWYCTLRGRPGKPPNGVRCNILRRYEVLLEIIEDRREHPKQKIFAGMDICTIVTAYPQVFLDEQERLRALSAAKLGITRGLDKARSKAGRLATHKDILEEFGHKAMMELIKAGQHVEGAEKYEILQTAIKQLQQYRPQESCRARVSCQALNREMATTPNRASILVRQMHQPRSDLHY